MKKEPINLKVFIIIASIVGVLGFVAFVIIAIFGIKYNKKVKEYGIKCEAVCTDRQQIKGHYSPRSHNRHLYYDYSFEVISPDTYKGKTFIKRTSNYNMFKVGDTTTVYYYEGYWHIFT